MPRVSNIEMLKKAEQPIISIRRKTAIKDLPMLIGESYGKMAAYLKEIGELLADVPFVAYHNMDMDNLDVEIGFPVSKTLPGKEEITSSSFPEEKVVFCMYRGAYTGMEPTYNEMTKWIAENGLKAKGVAYEYYYNGTEFPENDLLTRIVLPIE